MPYILPYNRLNTGSIGLFVSFCTFLLLLTSCRGAYHNHTQITNVKICNRLNNNQCTNNNVVFDISTPEIFVSCQLENAPENTIIEFIWYYSIKKIRIKTSTVSSYEEKSPVYFQSGLLKPERGWPKGTYEIEINIFGSDKKPVIKKFKMH